MNRAVLNKTNVIVAIIVAIVGLSGGAALVVCAHNADTQLVTDVQRQLIGISYRGRNGVAALTLLKQHTSVPTKHYLLLMYPIKQN